MPPYSTSCAAPRLSSPPRSPIPAICGSIRRRRRWAFAAPPVWSRCPRAVRLAAKSPSSSIPMPTAGSAGSKFSAATARSSASCRAALPALRFGPERAAASARRRCRFPGRKPSATAPSCARRSRHATVGRQINQQRPTFQQQRNPLRPNQPNQQRPGQLPGREQRPGLPQQRPDLRTVPGGQPLPSPGQRQPLQQQPGARPTQQQPGTPATPQQQQPGARPTQQQPGAAPPGGRPNAPKLQPQPDARPTLQRQPGAPPGPQRAPAGPRKPAKKNEGR